MEDANGVVKRTGRSKDLERREKNHAKDPETKDLKFKTDKRTDDYATQRGLEHKLHEKHKKTSSKENGGLNKIKAVRDNNPKKDSYIKAADDFINKKKD